MSRNVSISPPPQPQSNATELRAATYPETHPARSPHAPAAPTKRERPVIPIGTLVIVGFLLLNIVFFWMLVLGVQQGRA